MYSYTNKKIGERLIENYNRKKIKLKEKIK